MGRLGAGQSAERLSEEMLRRPLGGALDTGKKIDSSEAIKAAIGPHPLALTTTQVDDAGFRRAIAPVQLFQMHKTFLWVGKSLIGHCVFYQLVFALPIAATFLYLNHVDGTLTLTWAAHIALVSAVGGIIVAVSIWYTITLPRIKRR